MFKTFIFISKRTIFETVTVTKTDGECSVNVSERLTLKLARHLPMEPFSLILTFVKKARIENKVQVKVTGSSRLENGLVVPRS